MKISINQIKKDYSISPRVEKGTVAEIVEDYSECFDQLPPIVVFKTQDESKYVLVDGWHRLTAAEKLGLAEIEADVKYGSLKDALEFALLSNLKHGFPLTRKERRHVAAEFLKLHSERSDRWIADDIGIDKNTVSNIREKLEGNGEIHHLDELWTKDGRQIPRGNTKPPAKKETLQPELTLDSDSDLEESEPDPEPEPEPIIPKLGIYELNRAHQADCLEALQALPESSIDLVFTDPPYNIGIKYEQGNTDNLPTEVYFSWCAQWFMACHRVLKPGGALYVMHYPEIAARWKTQLDMMFTFRRWITWVYNSNIGHSNGNWSRSHRAILYYIKGSNPLYFNGEADPQPYKNPNDIRVKHIGKNGTTPYDWWEYNLVKNVSEDKTEWANQLPVALVKRVVMSSCPEEGVVCDPFMGSGTTAEAAVLAGRQWIGFDVSNKAVSITSNRLVNTQE